MTYPPPTIIIVEVGASCSRQYVSQLVSSHELPVIKEEGRIRLYSKSDVDRIKD